MLRILIFLFCATTFQLAYSQDFFDKPVRNLKSIDFLGLLTKGTTNFDYSTLNEKTLIVFPYDPKSSFQKYVKTKDLEKLPTKELKQKFYNEIWQRAFMESDYSSTHYEIGKTFEGIAETERDKYLYLSFYSNLGYDYALVWYFDKNKEPLPAMGVWINGLDLGNTNDLKLLLNLLHQNWSIYQDTYMLHQEAVKNTPNLTPDEMEVAKKVSSQQFYAGTKDYYAKQTANFITEGKSLTMLLPEEFKNSSLIKELENWTFTNYQFVSKDQILGKQKNNDPNYCYLKIQQAGSGMYASGMASVISTKGDRILHFTFMQGTSKTPEQWLPVIINDIESRIHSFDSKSTIVYKKIEFTNPTLPKDLSTSTIAYISLTENQHSWSKWINRSFEKKMKTYPYSYKIIKSINELDSCKYRIFLQSVMQPYTKVTTTYNKALIKDIEEDYIVKEHFRLFLLDISNGQTYLLPTDADFYMNTFKKFVDAVK